MNEQGEREKTSRVVSCAILGYGDRSSRYSEYALLCPDKLKVVAVIDINTIKLSQAKERFGLKDEQLFDSLDKFLQTGVKCDFVINGTMDELHYDTTMKLLQHRYNVLLEKPIVPNKKQLEKIEKTANKKGCKVLVCHVLRYTPFYSKIKQIIDSGEIGRVVDIQLNEHVWFGHFVNAYVRGKWRSEKACGSGLLLAKCCHDLDLMCWLNNYTVPTKVSSFGARGYFTPKNAPEGATEYCYQCPNNDKCMFDAYKFELEHDFIPFYTWAEINKPLDEISVDEKKAMLRSSPYGKCVYTVDGDIVDRQCVSVEFENGSIGTLNMVGASSKAGRHIHVICQYGEIVGYVEENAFTLRKFDKQALTHVDEIIDCSVTQNTSANSVSNAVAGHYGGDYFIMQDAVNFFGGGEVSACTTVLEDSVNSHLLCYGAEVSRKKNKIVSVKPHKSSK